MALSYQQKLDRQSGLGGSDIAAILGLSRYASPLDIYNDKVGELAEDTGNEATNRGNLLEPIIIQLYEEIGQLKVEVGHETFIHSKYPFLRANIDGMHAGSIVEAKSVHLWAKAAKDFGEEGTDQIPTEYLVQCAFYNEVVTDCDRVEIPTAFVRDNSGTKESIDRFAIYKYERNERLGQGIIQKAVQFWEEHVLKKRPPEGESLRVNTAPLSKGKIVTPELASIYTELAAINGQMEVLQRTKDLYKGRIIEYMEEFELLRDESGKELATWKTQTSNRFDFERFKAEHPDLYKQYMRQTTSRVFRIKGE